MQEIFEGKQSPGPLVYNVRGTDNFTYSKPPNWKIGTEVRNTLNTGAKFDFYNRQDVDYHPEEADKTRRTAYPAYGFKLESRFPNDPKRHKATPGPQYNPPHRQDVKNPEKYSFGFRREIQGASPLVANSSTPYIVGPGSYIQKNVPKTSVIEDEPHWSFGKGPKLHKQHPGWDKNQTYDTKTRAIGNQLKSQKKTLPKFSFGKARRDDKTGVFKDHMQNQPTAVRIQMPKF
ncbi:hypothetical protein PPERSA_06442 [Pseudocohnilembus persalinus]|uniref:Sperm-tail PG-rich repeat n=1 Tax=Pseudocohnilembus persalinus TaxID=266149 RepID=A0A0V0QS20_PSEPJ|nr:hypothetical protein PPERSA_06442 [Pseudocohnilembus persalinus]|eukprot:KRX04808.1 hypothetical protein PPERSA_06442 [Pseudocohnilembus persalinus]